MPTPPTPRRDALFAILVGVGGALAAWLTSSLAGMGALGAMTGLCAHATLGLLAFALLARRHDRSTTPSARVLIAFVLVISGWYSLFSATTCWFDTLQHQPNPPPEAFADGAALTGVVMAGWLPPLAAFTAYRLFVFIRGPRAA